MVTSIEFEDTHLRTTFYELVHEVRRVIRRFCDGKNHLLTRVRFGQCEKELAQKSPRVIAWDDDRQVDRMIRMSCEVVVGRGVGVRLACRRM